MAFRRFLFSNRGIYKRNDNRFQYRQGRTVCGFVRLKFKYVTVFMELELLSSRHCLLIQAECVCYMIRWSIPLLIKSVFGLA